VSLHELEFLELSSDLQRKVQSFLPNCRSLGLKKFRAIFSFLQSWCLCTKN